MFGSLASLVLSIALRTLVDADPGFAIASWFPGEGDRLPRAIEPPAAPSDVHRGGLASRRGYRFVDPWRE